MKGCMHFNAYQLRPIPSQRLRQIEQHEFGVGVRRDVQFCFVADRCPVTRLQRLAIQRDGATKHLKPCVRPEETLWLIEFPFSISDR